MLKNFGQKCAQLFQNKCCIVCLILLTFLVSIVIGGKIWLANILHEVEVESFGADFEPSSANNGVNGSLHLVGSDNSVEEELKKVPPEIRRAFPYTFAGFDWTNRPVWIIPFGAYDIRGTLAAKEENEKLLMIRLDLAVRRILASVKLKNATQFALIYDMDEYSYSQLISIKTVTFLAKMLTKYEPIFAQVAYVMAVNMDNFAMTLFKMVTPFMRSILDRIHIFGTDKDKFVGKILEKIPSHQLPTQYGGSKGYQALAIFE